ncbi:MAG: hypothetical protein R3B06_21450 [Kofleriaceae bacterium]
MKRRAIPTGSLTSLLDVLFILVFASLVQATARTQAAEPAPPPPPPAPTPPAPPASLVALRSAATAAVTAQVSSAPLAVARVGADGTLVDVEDAGGVRPVGQRLVVPDTNPDIGLRYGADLDPTLALCPRIARVLTAPTLAGHVVVIAPEVPLAELPVALVRGLARDVNRCHREHDALAIIVEPGALAPSTTPETP